MNLGELDDLNFKTFSSLMSDKFGLDMEHCAELDVKRAFSFFEFKKGFLKTKVNNEKFTDFKMQYKQIIEKPIQYFNDQGIKNEKYNIKLKMNLLNELKPLRLKRYKSADIL